MSDSRRKVAVIGSGVAGLTAAYTLRRDVDVTLYEAEDRCGGHAHTHDVSSEGESVSVDTGFLVHNQRNYPFLCGLFDELGVPTQDCEMSMSIRCDGCALEYCGAKGFRGLFAKPANVRSGRFVAMLAQVPRFHRHATRVMSGDADADVTIGRFLADGGYGEYFVRHFIVPLISAVWSCGSTVAREYPARYLFRFLDNHGMLSLGNTPQWRTVVGGSRTYVDAVLKQIPLVRTWCPVRSVTRGVDGAHVRDESDNVETFDAVVVATHADQALALLADPTEAEREVLSAFTYSANRTILHTDVSRLPTRRAAWGSWNYRQSSCEPGDAPVRVSYHLNRLHRLDIRSQFVVSLGEDYVARDSVLATMDYRHPVYTPDSVAAQDRLGDLNTATTAFAGAYHGWGFHEDGCRAGIAAAHSVGARP
ncbi:NAD(P)/FAD-dependent oxidoreductase [Stackebrandtia soli]|uniref:NAD(P)/FAD-dependent oxidoreductase n=1 Tax=Stackebrandtia soli TaxID=1892856 RepID=UPI0039E753B2